MMMTHLLVLGQHEKTKDLKNGLKNVLIPFAKKVSRDVTQGCCRIQMQLNLCCFCGLEINDFFTRPFSSDQDFLPLNLIRKPRGSFNFDTNEHSVEYWLFSAHVEKMERGLGINTVQYPFPVSRQN